MDRQFGITEARKRIAEIIDQAEHKGKSCIIIRHGRPAAAVVPMETYLQWKKEREDLLGVIRRNLVTKIDAS